MDGQPLDLTDAPGVVNIILAADATDLPVSGYTGAAVICARVPLLAATAAGVALQPESPRCRAPGPGGAASSARVGNCNGFFDPARALLQRHETVISAESSAHRACSRIRTVVGGGDRVPDRH
jgi:hypothetical protein